MNRISELWQPEEMADSHDTSWFIDYDETLGGLICWRKGSDNGREILFSQRIDQQENEREFIRKMWMCRSCEFGAALVGDVVVSTAAKVIGTLIEPYSFSQSLMFAAWDKAFN